MGREMQRIVRASESASRDTIVHIFESVQALVVVVPENSPVRLAYTSDRETPTMEIATWPF